MKVIMVTWRHGKLNIFMRLQKILFIVAMRMKFVSVSIGLKACYSFELKKNIFRKIYITQHNLS